MAQQQQQAKDYDVLLKTIILGDYNTGKGSVLLRYFDEGFQEGVKTMGVDFKIKTFVMNDIKIKLQIWDVNSCERYRTFTSAYYRGAHSFLILYDVTNQSSFDNLTFWINEIKKYSTISNPSIVIIGNKSDLPNHSVDPIKSKQFCDSHSIPSFQLVSAKLNLNIKEPFETLIQLMINNLDEIKISIDNNKKQLNNKNGGNNSTTTTTKCNI